MSRRSTSSGSTAFSSARLSIGGPSAFAPVTGAGAGGATSGLAGGAGGAAGAGASAAAGPGAGLAATIEPIVIDVGTHTVKFGFAGEPRPRAIVPAVQFAEPNAFLVAHPHPASSYVGAHAHPELVQGGSYGPGGSSSSNPAGSALWDLDFNRCKNERVRKEKTEYLLARLTTLFRKIINQHLMCDPRARRVILIENPLTPTVVRECTYTVLFKRLNVPAVTPLPSPLLSLLALGLPTGLLLSLGHLEASISPIFHGAPIFSSPAHPASLQVTLSSTRASGARLTRRLRALLIAYGQVIVSPPPNPGMGRAMASVAASSAARGSSHRASQFFTSLSPVSDPTKSRVEKVTAADLDTLGSDFLEQVKSKALVVGEPMVEGIETLAATLGPLSSDSRTAKSSRNTESAVSAVESLHVPPSTPGARSGVGRDFDWEQAFVSSSPYDDPLDADLEFLAALRTKYMKHTAGKSDKSSERSESATQPLYVSLPHISNAAHINRIPGLTLGGTSAAANVLASTTTPSQHRILIIPGWVRERCAEILFEARTDSVLRNTSLGEKAASQEEDRDGEEDDDQCSLTELVLRALEQVPLPLRRHFASRIAVSGGTAQLQGLAHRLRVEVVRALEALERITYFSEVHGDAAKRSPRSSSDLPSPSSGGTEDIRAEGSVPAVPRLAGISTNPLKQGPARRRVRRTETESALLADVPSLSTHELPLSWKRRYSKIGTLWRFVRVVNDHHPATGTTTISGAQRGIPVTVGPILDPDEIRAQERSDLLSPQPAGASRRRGRRSDTAQAQAEHMYAIISEPSVEHDPSAPYVPMYTAVEQQSLKRAHEHDVRYNLLNPKDTDRSKPYAGVAPTLAPSLLPWIGGSLVGSLRVPMTTPLLPVTPGMPFDKKDREAADGRNSLQAPGYGGGSGSAGGASSSGPRKSLGANASRRTQHHPVQEQYSNPVRRSLHLNHPATPDAPELPALAPPKLGLSVFLPVPTAFPGTISREQFVEDDAVRRRLGLASFGPNASAASAHGQGIDAEAAALLGGKGSFVGVVGGLDTGAYGGLAAVSRHMRGAWAAGTGGAPTSPRKE